MASTDMTSPDIDNAFIGIDSGGTRTTIRITIAGGGRDGGAGGDEGSDGDEIEFGLDEGLTATLAPDRIAEVMGRIFAAVDDRLAELDIGPVRRHVWISAAGYSPATRDAYREAAAAAANQTVGIANDGITLLIGTDADAIVIAGTGSNVLVRSRAGVIDQVGGAEWVASDTGSGFWIGLTAIRRAFGDFEAGHDSELLRRFRALYAIDDSPEQMRAKVRELSVADRNTKKAIAAMAVGVFAAAEAGCPDALAIVTDQAEGLADDLARLLGRHFTATELAAGVSVIRCGSVANHPLYRDLLAARVADRLGIAASVVWSPAPTGTEAAVALARQLAADPHAWDHLPPAHRPDLVARMRT